MPATLAIRLPARAEDAAESVLVVDGTPGAVVDVGALESHARRAEGNKVCVLVPGADVLLTRAIVPLRGGARVLQAVPYALEEQIAADVSDLHFAVGRRGPDGRVAVAAVARERMEEWLARLANAGLHPNALVAETAALPAQEHGAVVLIEGDRASSRCNGHTPLDCPIDELEQVLDLSGLVVAGAEASVPDTPTTLVVYVSDEDRVRHAALIDRLAARASRMELRSTLGHPLRVLAGEAVKPDALTLLQGAYAPRTALDTLWKPWRVAATVFAAFLVVTLGLQSVRLLHLRAREAQLDVATFEILSSACGVRTVADVRAQMQRCLDERLGSGPGEDVFLDMLGTLAAALRETPGTQIEQLSFRNRVLDLKLSVPDIDTLERIKSLVAERGALEMSIEQTRPGEGKVDSQIELREAERMNDQLKERLQQWWAGLQSRERWILAGGVAVVVLTLAYLVLDPLFNGVSERAARVAEKETLLASLQRGVARLPQAGAATPTTQPLFIINRTIQSAGLGPYLKDAQPIGAGDTGVRTQFEAVPFETLVQWLAQLASQHGLRVESAQLDTSGRPGTADARLSLERGGT